MKVLISAMACAPGQGSEQGVGWGWARAAAAHHEVWVLTLESQRAALEPELARNPVPRLHVEYLNLPGGAPPQPTRRHTYAFVIEWQRTAADRAQRMHDAIGFDIVHHLTMATDFLPIGVARVREVPLVLGPIGAAGGLPFPMWRWLGWRGALRRPLASAATRAMRRRYTDGAARRARVVLVTNHEVERRFARHGNTRVEPNARIAHEELPTLIGERRARTAVFIGRLVDVKAPYLAVAALADPALEGWRLEIIGDGPLRASTERRVDRLGLRDRVTFRGWLDRSATLEALATAHCLVFPGLVDPNSLTLSEATMLGTPVVAFDSFGPKVLLSDQPSGLVAIGWNAPHRFALAIAAQPLGMMPSDRWSQSHLSDLIDELYRSAARSAPA